MRDFILAEIKRLTAQNGTPPGRGTFTKETGITPAKWTGVYWAKWGDAIAEAGFEANSLQQRYDTRQIAQKLAELCRSLGRVPTRSEIKLASYNVASFPSHSTIGNHFPTNSDLIVALRQLSESPEYADIGPLLPEPDNERLHQSPRVGATEGVVYLLSSGSHFKVGRSDNLERRVREISVALPEATTLVHAIRTDDPVGIEAYWHRRFAERRANGEWFRLTPEDVRAFRRRTFQ